MNDKDDTVKTAIEIGAYASRLSATNQSYVLNTINALLFSQQAAETPDTQADKRDVGEDNGQNP